MRARRFRWSALFRFFLAFDVLPPRRGLVTWTLDAPSAVTWTFTSTLTTGPGEVATGVGAAVAWFEERFFAGGFLAGAAGGASEGAIG